MVEQENQRTIKMNKRFLKYGYRQGFKSHLFGFIAEIEHRGFWRMIFEYLKIFKIPFTRNKKINLAFGKSIDNLDSIERYIINNRNSNGKNNQYLKHYKDGYRDALMKISHNLNINGYEFTLICGVLNQSKSEYGLYKFLENQK